MTLHGGCHCGAISVAFETSKDPFALHLRACQCSFCRRHRGRTTSDPAGRLVITVHDAEVLSRYRFGLKMTDFLVCRVCGVYVAATTVEAGRGIGVLNVNVLEDQSAFDRPAEPMEYGREEATDRSARRAKAWMPVEVVD